MGNRIEKTTTIEIAGLPVIFYKMANADIFIDTQNVDNVFGIPLDPKIPFVTLYNASIKNDVLAYLDEMIYDLTSNCFKRKGNGVLCLITDNAQEDAVEISKMITPLGRKGQLKIALAIDETDTGNVYFQGNEETKNKTLIANFVMNCDMPIKDNYIHKEKMPFQLELEKKAEKFTLKDFNNGNFYLH